MEYFANAFLSYLNYFKISLTVRFEVFTAVTMKNAIFWDVEE
jgi:hypothetical protein